MSASVETQLRKAQKALASHQSAAAHDGFRQALDRVVSVDTSVAHLAGALGIGTHILLPFTPDWRWGLETSERIWYRSVTLHRQAADDDWEQVLDALHARLAGSGG